MHASLRELAASASVGLATLKHYFGRREDVIAAALQKKKEDGREVISELATPTGSFQQSINDALEHICAGFKYGGVGEIVSVGFVEGLRHPTLGPTVVEATLEPIIEAATSRLRTHQQRGEMAEDVDARIAAIALVSPVLLAFVHQNELGGSGCYPLSIEKLIEQHCAAFVRAYQASGKDQ